MAMELMCPDCGGVIGGDGSTGPRCQCGMASDDSPVAVSTSSAAAGESAVSPGDATKVCVNCGVDVTGKKRAKDSRGYWCYACHKMDKDKEKAERKSQPRCPECGRTAPSGSLATYGDGGVPICFKCREDHAETDKRNRKFRPSVGGNVYRQQERKRLVSLLAVVGVLVVIIVLNHFKLMPNLIPEHHAATKPAAAQPLDSGQ